MAPVAAIIRKAIDDYLARCEKAERSTKGTK